MGLSQLNFEGLNKVEKAIEVIRHYEPTEGYYLGFSGGKDSTVLYDLAIKAGVKSDAHYCVSPIDPPQLHQFIKEHFPDVVWDFHARGFWKLVVKKGLPLRQSRWCCEIIKEAGGGGRTKLLGMRRAESNTRQCYREFQRHTKQKDTWWCLPIVDWGDGEVWEYIKEHNLPYCGLYDEGFNRLGCVLCPFSRDIEREELYFPKIVKLWRRACDHIIKARLASGKEYTHSFSTGQELYDWWVARDQKGVATAHMLEM